MLRPQLIVPLAQDDRWALARGLLHDDGHGPADRVAGLLVLLFGQRPGKISGLTVGSVGLGDGHTILTLGTTPIRVPEPLATYLHELVGQRRHLSQVPAGGPGPWLFPGLHPGRPVLPATISHRLAASASIPSPAAQARSCSSRASCLPPCWPTCSACGPRPLSPGASSPGGPGAHIPHSATSRAEPGLGSFRKAGAGPPELYRTLSFG